MTGKRKSRYGFCVYCGQPATTKQAPPAPITCAPCRVLADVDPHYADPGDQWASTRA